jgi:hypothetical protein
MSKQEGKVNSLRQLWLNTQPAREKIGKVMNKTGKILGGIGKWIYRLRSVILTVPVALQALWLAGQNMTRLPGSVGLWIQESGEYYMMVNRTTAVTGPVVLTGVCLLLMFLSRRVVYPWLIALFTLIVPYVIYFSNVFPA